MARPPTGTVTSSGGIRPSTAAVRLLAGIREPCRLAATGNIDIATGGLLVVDSVQTVAGDRILVPAQTDATENGIYTASPGGPWYRASDARSPRAITLGVQVRVQEGTLHALSNWEFRTVSPDLGDDEIEISKQAFSGGAFGVFDMVSIGGTADALTATFTPPLTGRRQGQLLRIRTTLTNTGAMTLNPDGLGIDDLTMPDGSAIPAGAVQANTDYLLRDTGTDFRLFLSNITF